MKCGALVHDWVSPWGVGVHSCGQTVGYTLPLLKTGISCLTTGMARQLVCTGQLECVCTCLRGFSAGRHSVCVLVTSVITNCLPDYRMCVQVLALFVFYTVLLALYVNKIQCRGSFFCLFGSC